MRKNALFLLFGCGIRWSALLQTVNGWQCVQREALHVKKKYKITMLKLHFVTTQIIILTKTKGFFQGEGFILHQIFANQIMNFFYHFSRVLIFLPVLLFQYGGFVCLFFRYLCHGNKKIFFFITLVFFFFFVILITPLSKWFLQVNVCLFLLCQHFFFEMILAETNK